MNAALRKAAWFAILYIGGISVVGAMALVIRAFLKV
jgi:hypothetical protein